MWLIIKKYLLIIFLLLTVYTAFRLAFYFIYFFPADLSFREIVSMFYWGCRLDFTLLFYINLPFLFFHFFLSGLFSPAKARIISILLLLINLPMLAIEFIDLVYYRFNLRRSNYDLFFVFRDSGSAFISFFKTWWYLFLIFFCIGFLILFLQWKILSYRNPAAWRGKHYLIFTLIVAVGMLIARGGRARPILPSTPLLYFSPVYKPLVSNSGITFLYSIIKEKHALQELSHFNEQQLDSLFTIRRQYADTTDFQKKNVVIIILESFAKAYLTPGDSLKAVTPFLDSIMKESLVCTNAYANGLESNQGLVAILAGLPPFTEIPYFHSRYGNNQIRGIGTLLKEEGYSTCFFMGAGEDHFGFGKLCRILGIDEYISATDYNNDEHHDGEWGISDHYFLPFAGRMLTGKTGPFLAVLFNLSSHPPYVIPDTLKQNFTLAGQTPAQNSISYTDYSLRLFFQEIRNQPWYRNAVFAFVADHSAAGLIDRPVNSLNAFTIPLFFHLPGAKLPDTITRPVQQLDVVPALLDLLNYSKPFMSFGESVLKPGKRFVYNRINGMDQVIDESHIAGFQMNSGVIAYKFNYRTDPGLQVNLLHDTTLKNTRLGIRSKAFLQRYHQSMRKNQLFVK